MINSMRTVIRCTEYEIKKARPHSESARVGIPKKYVNNDIMLVPLIAETTIRKQDGEFIIICDSEICLKKEVKLRGTSGIAFVPIEYLDMDILIVPIL